MRCPDALLAMSSSKTLPQPERSSLPLSLLSAVAYYIVFSRRAYIAIWCYIFFLFACPAVRSKFFLTDMLLNLQMQGVTAMGGHCNRGDPGDDCDHVGCPGRCAGSQAHISVVQVSVLVVMVVIRSEVIRVALSAWVVMITGIDDLVACSRSCVRALKSIPPWRHGRSVSWVAQIKLVYVGSG